MPLMSKTYIIKNAFGQYYTGHEGDGRLSVSVYQKDAMRFNMQHPDRTTFAEVFGLSEDKLSNKQWAKETRDELVARGIMSEHARILVLKSKAAK